MEVEQAIVKDFEKYVELIKLDNITEAAPFKDAILKWLEKDSNKKVYKQRIGGPTATDIDRIYKQYPPNDSVDEVYFKLLEHGFLMKTIQDMKRATDESGSHYQKRIQRFNTISAPIRFDDDDEEDDFIVDIISEIFQTYKDNQTNETLALSLTTDLKNKLEDEIIKQGYSQDDILNHVNSATAEELYKLYIEKQPSDQSQTEILDQNAYNRFFTTIINEIFNYLITLGFIITDPKVIKNIKDSTVSSALQIYAINFKVESELIEKLDPLYDSICTNRNEDKMDDFGVQQLNIPNVILFFKIYERIMCYDALIIISEVRKLDNILKNWVKNTNASIWNPRNVDFNMKVFNEGYGGMAGNKRYFKLPIGPTSEMLINDNGIEEILTNGIKSGIYHVEEVEKQRVGNTNSQFGVGDTHGQNDIRTIYTLRFVPENKLEEPNKTTLETISKERRDAIEELDKAFKMHNRLEKPLLKAVQQTTLNKYEESKNIWPSQFIDIFNDPSFVSLLPDEDKSIFKINDFVVINNSSKLGSEEVLLRSPFNFYTFGEVRQKFRGFTNQVLTKEDMDYYYKIKIYDKSLVEDDVPEDSLASSSPEEAMYFDYVKRLIPDFRGSCGNEELFIFIPSLAVIKDVFDYDQHQIALFIDIDKPIQGVDDTDEEIRQSKAEKMEQELVEEKLGELSMIKKEGDSYKVILGLGITKKFVDKDDPNWDSPDKSIPDWAIHAEEQFYIADTNIYTIDDLFLPIPKFEQPVIIFRCLQFPESVKPLYLRGTFFDFAVNDSEESFILFKFILENPTETGLTEVVCNKITDFICIGDEVQLSEIPTLEDFQGDTQQGYELRENYRDLLHTSQRADQSLMSISESSDDEQQSESSEPVARTLDFGVSESSEDEQQSESSEPVARTLDFGDSPVNPPLGADEDLMRRLESYAQRDPAGAQRRSSRITELGFPEVPGQQQSVRDWMSEQEQSLGMTPPPGPRTPPDSPPDSPYRVASPNYIGSSLDPEEIEDDLRAMNASFYSTPPRPIPEHEGPPDINRQRQYGESDESNDEELLAEMDAVLEMGGGKRKTRRLHKRTRGRRRGSRKKRKTRK